MNGCGEWARWIGVSGKKDGTKERGKGRGE